LEKLNFQGRRLNSFSLEKPIYAVSKGQAEDISSEMLFLAMGDEILRYDSSKNIFTRISALPAEDVYVSKGGDFLHVEGGGRYSVFSYPAMKLFYSENAEGKFIYNSGGNAVNFSDSMIKFLDFKQKKITGRIVILNDAIGFISANFDYYGNEQFRQAVLNGLISGINSYLLKDKQPDAKLACGGFSGFFGDLPKSAAPTSTPQTPKPQAPQAPSQPVQPVPPPVSAGSGQFAAPSPTAPIIPPSAAATDNSTTLTLTTPPMSSEPPRPAPPLFDTIPIPVLAPGNTIPDWVMRPSALPEFSAVKSGKLPAAALKESKIKIRDDVARAVMKNMLEIEIVKNLPTDEVKKRFLWMVGGRTAQLASDYTVQSDIWVSKENIYYVWGHISAETVNQIYDPIFQEEMSLLNTYGSEGYLNRPPLKWE
jgi:hypothetical protein